MRSGREGGLLLACLFSVFTFLSVKFCSNSNSSSSSCFGPPAACVRCGCGDESSSLLMAVRLRERRRMSRAGGACECECECKRASVRCRLMCYVSECGGRTRVVGCSSGRARRNEQAERERRVGEPSGGGTVVALDGNPHRTLIHMHHSLLSSRQMQQRGSDSGEGGE